MEVPPALVVFCRDQYPRIVGTLRLYTGDALLAEELAQDTFVRVCRDWERVRQMDSPGAWTHQVALNLVRSRQPRRLAEGRMQTRIAGFARRRHRSQRASVAASCSRNGSSSSSSRALMSGSGSTISTRTSMAPERT